MSTSEDQSGATWLYTPCPGLTGVPNTPELVKTCSFCGKFYATCCFHKRIVCHHRYILYTDGAWTNNGRPDAVSGLGIAFGTSKSKGDLDDEDSERHQFSIPHRLHESEQLEIVITTDSEYVVNGMTEWLPTWKKNDFRKANGKRPVNIDLFRSLDEEVERREREHDIKVKFWHVNREYNMIADGLAKRGASIAAPAEDGGVEKITALLQVVHVL